MPAVIRLNAEAFQRAGSLAAIPRAYERRWVAKTESTEGRCGKVHAGGVNTAYPPNCASDKGWRNPPQPERRSVPPGI